MIGLSVVVIARNEERTIGRCLESVSEMVAGRSAEVVLVDSASTDGTVAVARRHPVRVVRLEPWARRSPAVARRLGAAVTSGPLVLFVDGDSVLDPAWLEPALRALDEDPMLAGVAGACEGLLAGGRRDQYPGAAYEDAPHLSGCALYRRAALERVGGFNAALYGGEEVELGVRLRAAGYRLRRLRCRMSQHFPRAARETVPELLRRTRRRYPIGMGQLVRHAHAAGLPVRSPLTAIDRHLAFFTLMVLGLVGAGATLVGGALRAFGIWLGAVWLGLLATGFSVFAWRARSLRKPAYYFLEWAITSPLVVWGLLLRPVSADDFDLRQSPHRVLLPATDGRQTGR